MRLIDAEALENELVKTMRYVPKNAVLDVACMVNRAPTIEAKPIVHAHWEGDAFGVWCSRCEKSALWNCYDMDEESKFCPHCGAQMDEGVKIPVISMEDVPKIMEEMEK